MLFQIESMWQILGWVLVFAGLVIMNEIGRRSKAGGILLFVIIPVILTVYFILAHVGLFGGAENPTVAYIPCVKEIPELQELYKEMKDKGVGVAGVVLDTTDEKGNQDEEAVKKAGILQEKTKAEYPFLIPDTTMMNGRLQGISAFPETFFVDKDGNIVGDTYTGSHTLDEWKEIVEKELKNVSK